MKRMTKRANLFLKAKALMSGRERFSQTPTEYFDAASFAFVLLVGTSTRYKIHYDLGLVLISKDIFVCYDSHFHWRGEKISCHFTFEGRTFKFTGGLGWDQKRGSPLYIVTIGEIRGVKTTPPF